MELSSLNILLVAILPLIVILVIVVLVRLHRFERSTSTALASLHSPLAIASKHDLLPIFRRLTDAIKQLAELDDPLLHHLATLRLTAMADEAENLGRGIVVFQGTETWRAAYQDLLTTLNVKSYYSVAWVRSEHYWNDTPGRQSMQMNFDLAARGFHIQRIHILPSQLWPFDEQLPVAAIRHWLSEQHDRGIVVRLVREADLAKEADLLQNFAIYGDRATAVQELDKESKTLRFVLSFDRDSIRQSLDRWGRLALYARSWEKSGK